MARVASAHRKLGRHGRVTIDHTSGSGRRLSINGEPIDRTDTRIIMNNLLDTWLGPDAVPGQLRRQLLSGKINNDMARISRSRVCTTREASIG